MYLITSLRKTLQGPVSCCDHAWQQPPCESDACRAPRDEHSVNPSHASDHLTWGSTIDIEYYSLYIYGVNPQVVLSAFWVVMGIRVRSVAGHFSRVVLEDAVTAQVALINALINNLGICWVKYGNVRWAVVWSSCRVTPPCMVSQDGGELY